MVRNLAITVALIGVSGTLLGVALGFFLNRLASLGKIKIFIKSHSLHYSERDNQGGAITTESLTPNSNRATFSFDLEIYNSASDFKIMRELSLVVLNRSKKETIPLMDNATRRLDSYRTMIDNVQPITLPPKTIITLSLAAFIKENLNSLSESQFYFKYENHKKKSKLIKIN